MGMTLKGQNGDKCGYIGMTFFKALAVVTLKRFFFVLLLFLFFSTDDQLLTIKEVKKGFFPLENKAARSEGTLPLLT